MLEHLPRWAVLRLRSLPFLRVPGTRRVLVQLQDVGPTYRDAAQPKGLSEQAGKVGDLWVEDSGTLGEWF